MNSYDYERIVSERWPVSFDSKGLIEEGDHFLYTLGEIGDLDRDDLKIRVFTDDTLHDSISLIHPRVAQRTIAPGRDFYVSGVLNPINDIDDDATLIVRLIQNNRVVRAVFCNKKDDQDNMFVGPERNKKLNYFPYLFSKSIDIETVHSVAKKSCCPDLVCSHIGLATHSNVNLDNITPSDIIEKDMSDEEAFSYTWNKAYYTDTFFSATIYGGAYGKEIIDDLASDDPEPERSIKIKTTDASGNEMTPLEEGDYLLSIELTNKDGTLVAAARYNITIGNLPNKVLSTFSYDIRLGCNHMHNLEFVENSKGIEHVLLWDPFPGFWTSALLYGNPALRKGIDSKITFALAVNAKRAVLNDSLEYRGGHIHFYNYGVLEESASLCVELAEVFKQRASGHHIPLSCYHYIYGEPNLATGRNNSLEINDMFSSYRFTEFKTPIEFLRSATFKYKSTGAAKENVLDLDTLENIKYSAIGSSPIVMEKDDRLAIVGVCNIPNQAEIVDRDDYLFYRDVNRIVTIKYDVIYNGKCYRTLEHKVSMARQAHNIKNENQIITRFGAFEFQHVFLPSDLRCAPGPHTIHLKVSDYSYKLSDTSSPKNTDDIFTITILFRA